MKVTRRATPPLGILHPQGSKFPARFPVKKICSTPVGFLGLQEKRNNADIIIRNIPLSETVTVHLIFAFDAVDCEFIGFFSKYLG
jgi:hypothetical protein